MAEEEQIQEPESVVKPEPVDMISKANEAAERIEKANEKLESLLSKQEALQVERTLGGSSSTNLSKEQTKEEKEIESAKKMLEGTGYEDML